MLGTRIPPTVPYPTGLQPAEADSTLDLIPYPDSLASSGEEEQDLPNEPAPPAEPQFQSEPALHILRAEPELQKEQPEIRELPEYECHAALLHGPGCYAAPLADLEVEVLSSDWENEEEEEDTTFHLGPVPDKDRHETQSIEMH